MKEHGMRQMLSVVLAGVACVALALWTPLAPAAENEMTDQAITDAVEDEILLDPAVSLSGIDIETVNGIVTLSGSVNNILAHDRAERIAETVKGVRSVVNKIQVAPSVDLADAVIEENVEDSLLYNPATDSYELDVLVTDGVVTLSGTVASWQEQELAQKVAKGVQGVTQVIDDIEVEYESERADPEIRAEVEEALRWDALVDHALIDVSVENGVVTLDGTVGSAAEKTLAAANAWVAGVDSVNSDELDVDRWARDEDLRKNKFVVKSDEEVENAIEDALLYDPRVLSTNVTTEVTAGTVTLRGEVATLNAKRAAAQTARNTVGVAQVENRLRIRPLGGLSDDEIAENVRQALERDPYVERYEITVSVIDGTVYLYGDVDSYFEKAQADDVASGAAGVVSVDNNLNVQADYEPYTYDPYVDDYYTYDYDWYDYEAPPAKKPDWEIEEEIKSELWWSPFVDSDTVNVSVDDGTATLTGTVESWSEYWSARENAFDGGAVWVDNDLKVE